MATEVIGSLQYGIEHLLRADAIVQALSGRGCVAFMEHIFAAQSYRRDAHFMRDLLHLQLAGKSGLRHAETTKCAIGRSVGCHHAPGDARVGAVVWPDGMNYSARQHYRAERAIS